MKIAVKYDKINKKPALRQVLIFHGAYCTTTRTANLYQHIFVTGKGTSHPGV